jgi:hypothetical protein
MVHRVWRSSLLRRLVEEDDSLPWPKGRYPAGNHSHFDVAMHRQDRSNRTLADREAETRNPSSAWKQTPTSRNLAFYLSVLWPRLRDQVDFGIVSWIQGMVAVSTSFLGPCPPGSQRLRT